MQQQHILISIHFALVSSRKFLRLGEKVKTHENRRFHSLFGVFFLSSGRDGLIEPAKLFVSSEICCWMCAKIPSRSRATCGYIYVYYCGLLFNVLHSESKFQTFVRFRRDQIWCEIWGFVTVLIHLLWNYGFSVGKKIFVERTNVQKHWHSKRSLPGTIIHLCIKNIDVLLHVCR